MRESESPLRRYVRRTVVTGATVIAFFTSVSPEEATSRIAGWLAFVGVDSVPAVLADRAADEWLRSGALVVLTFIVASWWHRWRSGRSAANGPVSVHALVAQLDWLAAYLRQEARMFGFSNNLSPITEVYAIRMSLAQHGIAFPEHLVTYPPTPDVYLRVANYFDWIAPLIRDGHLEEARKVATFAAQQDAGAVQ